MLTALLVTLVADLIHLKDGRVWTGDIVEELPERVKIKLPKGAIWVSRSEIDRIESVEDLRGQYRERAATAATAESHRELANWCRERGLAAEERAEWEAVARLAPDDEEAHGKLGHVRHDGKWMTEEEAAKAKGLVERDGEWVTPLRAQVLDLLDRTDTEDLVARGEARKELRALGDAAMAEVAAVADEADARLAAALAKEELVLDAIEVRTKTARVTLVSHVSDPERFPKGANDAEMQRMRSLLAEVTLAGEDPAQAYVAGEPELARAARRLELADAAAGAEPRLPRLYRAFADKLGRDAVYRRMDPYSGLRAKVDAENAKEELGESERALLEETNRYRLRCGRAPLRWDAKLAKCARQHSDEMEKLGYFSHVSPTDKYATLTKRAELVGFRSAWIGENIARGQDPPDLVMKAFQDSPNHHRNIVFGDYTRIGIARAGEFWTVNFGADPK